MTAPATLPFPGSLDDLPTDRALVWLVELPAGHLSGAVRTLLADHLDDATLDRLGRLRLREDLDRGLVAHGLLRHLLGLAVGGRPEQIRLATSCAACGSVSHGKPRLAGSGAPPLLRFNLSHSGDRVGVVLTAPDLDPGIDLERRSRTVDWAALRSSVFTDEEWELSAAAPDPTSAREDLWSRKEACVKATGHGLGLPLRSVAVTIGVGGRARWAARLSVAEDRAAGARIAGWDLGEAIPDGRTAAALALRSRRAGASEPGEPRMHLLSLR